MERNELPNKTFSSFKSSFNPRCLRYQAHVSFNSLAITQVFKPDWLGNKVLNLFISQIFGQRWFNYVTFIKVHQFIISTCVKIYWWTHNFCYYNWSLGNGSFRISIIFCTAIFRTRLSWSPGIEIRILSGWQIKALFLITFVAILQASVWGNDRIFLIRLNKFVLPFVIEWQLNKFDMHSIDQY